jgi:hypothetical protein
MTSFIINVSWSYDCAMCDNKNPRRYVIVSPDGGVDYITYTNEHYCGVWDWGFHCSENWECGLLGYDAMKC